MKTDRVSIEELREKINSGEIQDPLWFLESYMNGIDPRTTSKLHILVNEIHEFTDGEPSPDDWAEVVEHVNRYHRYSSVTVTQSQSAAKTLAEFIHPRLKQIESSKTSENENVKNNPLTEEEIKLFKEKFNEEF